IWSNPTFSLRQYALIAGGLLVLAGGIVLLAATASPSASLTADNGTLTSGASIQSSTAASDGKGYVEFGGQQASIPKHVETWAYDDSTSGSSCNGGYGASASLVQQWLSYAETNCGPGATKALSDCHAGGVVYCKVMAYLETNFIYSNSPLRGACSDLSCYPEDFWLHKPGVTPSSSTRLSFTSSYDNPTTTDYYLNKRSTDVDSWFQNYARTNYGNYDGFMMDDSGGSLSGLIANNDQGATSTYEITSNAELIASYDQLAGYLTKTDGTPYIKIDNGLDPWPVYDQDFTRLDNAKGVDGLLAEGSPISNNNIGSDPEGYPEYAHADKYATLLDDMSYIDSTSGFMVLLSYDSSGSSTQLASRRMQAATDLLGYSPGHIVSWSDLEQNNDNLAVWPEEGIYPTSPVQTMGAPSGSGCLTGNNGNNGFGNVCSSGGHNDLQVATGVYRREFGECYNQGTAFGNCAVIVNDTPSPVAVQSSWLTHSYGHQITMVGEDVQSGGTINLTGSGFSPGTTTVPAYDAMLLAP
ncbi:MAG TPA: hypothetical protein VMR75_02765, partial [Candidatus Saccharimonadales bacterium]|nr:hypothetical protein [Candidatus Saccharimonadales bacterium]